ncbi:hypothetical protein ZWY2020_010745 [Hordeum vulgare]|nr:hypothetical protein ZWY2020_010745 [Hordeum vulgare]
MRVPPRWCVDKMDCWEALVDQCCSKTWEASHNNAKERRGKMAAIQKEREAMQAAMEEKDKEMRELEERTTALVEAGRAWNDASQRAIYELFVNMSRNASHDPSTLQPSPGQPSPGETSQSHRASPP